jgi:hypothetical protein
MSCRPTGRPSAGLPEGWHGRAGSHHRSNRTDIVKSPRFRQVGWTAMLGAPPAAPRTLPTGWNTTAAAARDGHRSDLACLPTRRHERDCHHRDSCGRSARIGDGPFPDSCHERDRNRPHIRMQRRMIAPGDQHTRRTQRQRSAAG